LLQPCGKMAEFRFLGYLADMIGERVVNIPLENPIKLRDILRVEFPEDRSTVLINQQAGNFNSLILDEDKVIIMPIISGG